MMNKALEDLAQRAGVAHKVDRIQAFLDGYDVELIAGSAPLPTGFVAFLAEEAELTAEESQQFADTITEDGKTLIDHEQVMVSSIVTDIIFGEVERQNTMWGNTNERADISQGQLLQAARAQAAALTARRCGVDDAFDGGFDGAPTCYPPDWSGFRDYGSDIANLAVTTVYLFQEIKRLVREGKSAYRKPRDPDTQPYTGDQPKVLTK